MKLIALIGDREYELNSEEVLELDAQETGSLEYHVLTKHNAYHARILSMDPATKQVVIEVNGNVHTVQIKNELDLAVQEMGFKLSSDKVDNLIFAPMPGLILDVLVKEGQEVEKGQGLLILEAMKMENVIKAENSGVIRKISINKGDAVEKKELLIELEL